MFDVKKQKTARQQQVAAKDNPKTKQKPSNYVKKLLPMLLLCTWVGGREGRKEGRRE
jgi:hypothetical protein